MKKLLLSLFLFASIAASAQVKLVTQYGVLVQDTAFLSTTNALIATKMSTATANSTFLPVGSSAVGFTGALAGDVQGNQGTTTVTKINGVTLSGLATGIYKNTTGTGVLSIAVAADFPTLNQSTTGNASTATLATNVTTNANTTGDVTSVGNVTTLATVNTAVGTYTNATVTVNAKGQVTLISSGAAASTPIKNEEYTSSSTTTITLLHSPVTGQVDCWKNGTKLPSTKFSMSGATVTLTDARTAADGFSFNYSY